MFTLSLCHLRFSAVVLFPSDVFDFPLGFLPTVLLMLMIIVTDFNILLYSRHYRMDFNVLTLTVLTL